MSGGADGGGRQPRRPVKANRPGMGKAQGRGLARILAAAAIFLVGSLPPARGLPGVVILLVAYAAAGWDVLWRALRNILHGKRFDENFLMAVATVGAIALGGYAEGAAVMLFYQVGEWFQRYAVGRSRRSIAQLMDIRPDHANLLNADGALCRAEPDTVEVGSLIVVKPGERVPLDGVVDAGTGALDTGALTGESAPRNVAPGDEVMSGCVNLNSVLTVRVAKVYGESTVARILRLVESSGSKKAGSERFITRFARWYTPAVCFGALVLALLPPLAAGQAFGPWVYRALTFLVISCPCALVISVPLSFFGGIGGAGKRGVLVKGSGYLEVLAKTETAVFDKTGTLTQGRFEVAGLHPASVSADALLELAACAERYSEHPIAQSVKRAYGREADPGRVQNAGETAGLGVHAVVDGKTVLVGNARLMRENGIAPPPADEPGTVVHVAAGGVYAGWLLVTDPQKPDAAEAIMKLRGMGVLKTVMLTGDADAVGRKVAARLGVDEVYTQLLPQDKVAELEALLAAPGRKGSLMYVGDGVNDAPVLARADVGVAMGGLGSDAAIEAADVVIMTDEPSRLVTAIGIARKTVGIAKQNIVFALGVKAVVLALGAFGLAGMWGAVFADVGVLVIAILNAMRAMRYKEN